MSKRPGTCRGEPSAFALRASTFANGYGGQVGGQVGVRPLREITDDKKFPGGDLQDLICNVCQEYLDVILKELTPVLI